MTPYIWDSDMIYGAYFLTTICPLHQNGNHTSSRSVRSSVLPTTIHLCSPLVIQLCTLAPATDVADRFLIILSLSARSSVCFKLARNVVSRRTEEWHCNNWWMESWRCCYLLQATAASVSPQSRTVPFRLYMWCPVISTLFLCVVSIFKSSDLEPQCTLEGTEFRLAGEGASALNLGCGFTFWRSGSQYSQTSPGLWKGEMVRNVDK